MKFIVLFIACACLSTPSFSQKKVVEDSIQVYGNCMMCKARIEEAVVDLNGVKFAEWNVKTKKLFIAYKEDKIAEEQIHEAIVKVGHDTDLKKADIEVYSKLPFCCLFRDHDPHGPYGEELHK